jgi:hypothetical protein
MVHHFIHLFEGLALTLLVIGFALGWIPTVIYYRHKIKKVRNQA